MRRSDIIWMPHSTLTLPEPSERFLATTDMLGPIRLKVTINCAMSADGKIALTSRQQTDISNDLDKRRVHELRNSVDAILVGIGTVLTDNPRLTVKTEYVDDRRNPIRVVLDSRGRTPNEALVLNGEARTVIVTAEECDRTFPNAEVIRSGIGRVDLQKALRALEEMGVQSLLVEGGAEVIWSFLKSRLADEMIIFIGSLVIGGDSSPTPAGGEGASSLEDTVELRLMNAEMLGDGILLEYEVAK